MHQDARQLQNETILEGDVCIVGAGAAGISMALEWNGSSHKVILLESGGFEYEDNIQDLYKGQVTGQKYYPMRSNRLSFFGGTTNHWAGMCSPFDDIDFAKRDWVPHSGWPIGRKELDPFYARANKVLKLGPYEYDIAYWQKQVPNLKPFPLSPEVIWYKMWQNSPLNGWSGGLAKEYRETIVNSSNIELFTYATVTEIVANNSVSEVSKLVVKNHAGKSLTVKARHVILACGAIQNARMLLASNRQAPNGIGNDHDIVGRFFMEHLEVDAAELWLMRPFPTDLFKWDKIWCELAIRPEIQERDQILSGTAGANELTWGIHAKPRMETYQDDDPRKALDNMYKDWGKADSLAKLKKEGSIARAFQLQTRLEQAPNPDSRITLGSERDALGVPQANLHWKLTDLDKRSVRRINEIIGEESGKADFARLRLAEPFRDKNDMSWPDTINGGWHHMGTVRMGEDPKSSVVDVNCRVHGLKNLYVAGAACYPTSGAPNPSLTLVALSLRLADFVKERLKGSV